MKKMTKRLGAIFLALALCFSLCCTALVSAEDGDDTADYTITVSNAKAGHTYTAYKIFDATVLVNSDGTTAVAYSLSSDDPIYSYVTEDNYSVTDENGQNHSYPNPFEFTQTTVINGITSYTVTVKTGFTDTNIIEFLNAMIDVVPADALIVAASQEAETNGELTLNLFDAGYYFVTSTLGTVVSITTTDPHAEVIEKNDIPSVEKDIKNGLDIDESMHGDTEAMGDDVEFLVDAYVPLYSAADAVSPEGYLITDYEFTDHMSAGLEIRGLVAGTDYNVVTDSTGTHYYATESLISSWVKIYDNDTECALFGDNKVIYNPVLEMTDASTYTEDGVSGTQFDGFIFTYDTIPDKDALDGNTYEKASDIVTNYPENASLTIDYTAHVTEDAEYDNTNEITMDYHMTTFKNPNQPRYEGEEEDRDDVYVLQLVISKVDGKTETSLSGAEFALTGEHLNDVVSGSSYTYTPLTKAEYDVAVENGTELWWKLVDTDESTDNYTSVNPYTTDGVELDKYVYDDQPDAPEDYHYVAYVRTESSDETLQPAADSYVTGVTDSNGKLTFVGLTEGKWTLTEIKAPDGYNLVSDALSFTISVVSWETDPTTGIVRPVWSLSSDDDFDLDDDTAIISITVENNQGTELPGTGGIGTTIFYIIGGVLVAGAVVVLVTRRRMTRED